MVNKTGYHWFAMTDGSQITCLDGSFYQSTPPYVGCTGDPYIYISENQFQRFELINKLDGYWYARVYEIDGTGHEVGHDVARITLSNLVISRINATFEQYWGGQSSNLYNNAVFVFKHPQYMKWGVGFQEWPNSDIAPLYSPQTSFVYPSGHNGTGFCPTHYGASWNFGNNPRIWYAGSWVSSLNIICNFNLFQFNYMPTIYKSP
ncbi:MAG TPA: hypothetical protein VF338_09265 [Leptolinea sp.]